jgi:hypothetical protein
MTMGTSSQIAPSGTTDLRAAVDAGLNAFRFKVELSLAPVIRFWTESFGDDGSAPSAVAAIIRKELERTPELLGVIDDPAVIARHRKMVDVLMAAAFPPAFWHQEYSAALVPFQLHSVYATPPFERLLMGEDGRLKVRMGYAGREVSLFRLRFAYALVLERVYGLSLPLDYALIFTVTDPETGLDRHFQVEFDGRFIDVETPDGAPPLPDLVRQQLLARTLELETLESILPPERFVFRGVTIFRAIDVTDHEVLSSLKRDLIEKESIVSATRFMGLQEKLRTLFRRPELRFGLAALDGDRVLKLNSGARIEKACIFAESVHHKTSDFTGSIYERAVLSEQPVIVDDLNAMPDRTAVENMVLDAGVRSMLVAPLRYQERIIGTLDLVSPRPGDFNLSHLPKLDDVLPLFSMAVQRSMEELNTRVQAFIKEKCTAIHPTVEWRFRDAVLEMIEGQRTCGPTGSSEMATIVFADVQPLYALSDIRGSSTQRAIAIQADLLAQLRLGRTVVETARQARPQPALDELLYRIEARATEVAQGLKSGDEIGVIGFLRTEVEPLFGHLQQFAPAVAAAVETYQHALDPRLSTVYDQRRRFEESVTGIAETISSYLDLEEQAAQGLAPHYFEKQKTDGVDYQMYVGASLLEDGKLDPLALKNLRLWQLMVTCGVALRADQLRARLPIPLETTHLILVQHAPLSIRFRFDEKRFDVDGAYDIRYEIVKKRIDKALVQGTGERATQPGKIAIIYSQPSEAAEYRGYIQYLQGLGYLTGEIEDLHLEELQGVHGLRALRVTVDLRNPHIVRPVPLAELAAALN